MQKINQTVPKENQDRIKKTMIKLINKYKAEYSQQVTEEQKAS